MASSIEKDITSLPQKGMWHVYVHKLRAWVAGDDGLPVRPYLMLVVSTEVGEDLTQGPLRIVSGEGRESGADHTAH